MMLFNQHKGLLRTRRLIFPLIIRAGGWPVIEDKFKELRLIEKAAMIRDRHQWVCWLVQSWYLMKLFEPWGNAKVPSFHRSGVILILCFHACNVFKVLLTVYRSFVFVPFRSKTGWYVIWMVLPFFCVSLFMIISTDLMEIVGDFNFRGLSMLYLMYFVSFEIAAIVSALLISWTSYYFTQDVVVMHLFPFVRQRLRWACKIGKAMPCQELMGIIMHRMV